MRTVLSIGPHVASWHMSLSNVIKENYKYISFSYLLPLLVQEGLLDLKYCADMEMAEARFTSLLEDPRLYPRIRSCVERESEHLGHRYVASLLKGGPPTDSTTINASSNFESLISRNFNSFVQNVSVPSLVPFLHQKALLTTDESKVLYNITSQYEGAIKLFGLLGSKGPIAYYLFAECLREETTQPQHAELYSLMTKGEERASTTHEVLESEGNRRCFTAPNH